MCGSLTVAVSDDEMAAFEQLRAAVCRRPAAQADGYAELSPEQARALFPPLAPVRGAIHCGHHARVDGRLLAAAFREVALAHGLGIREAEVSDLLVEHGAVRSVAIDGEALPAGHVVIAAGAWSKSLCERIGVLIPVAPQRGQIVHLTLPDTDTGGWPIVRAFRDHYMVPWPGRLVVGATRESVGFAPRTTLAGIMEVLAEAVRVAPGLRGAALAEVRVGLRPASPDSLPILGRAPGIANPPPGDRARRGRPAARPLQRQGDRRCHHPGRSGRRPRAVRAGPPAPTNGALTPAPDPLGGDPASPYLQERRQSRGRSRTTR